jgi:hypothetical protein
MREGAIETTPTIAERIDAYLAKYPYLYEESKSLLQAARGEITRLTDANEGLAAERDAILEQAEVIRKDVMSHLKKERDSHREWWATATATIAEQAKRITGLEARLAEPRPLAEAIARNAGARPCCPRCARTTYHAEDFRDDNGDVLNSWIVCDDCGHEWQWQTTSAKNAEPELPELSDHERLCVRVAKLEAAVERLQSPASDPAIQKFVDECGVPPNPLYAAVLALCRAALARKEGGS